jgi:hypothetical protein
MTYGVTSALVGEKWPASRPGHFIYEENATGTFWIECEVGLRSGVDAVEAYVN